ncbi:MAG: 4-hydroxythreonine-4-phosphate dehydrogenase PdxA [Acidobacteria bacterium]|nr:4-hydroxythreonine-4-phosphate dehydrogenase PdxA [Acidobacteriota bacterium]
MPDTLQKPLALSLGDPAGIGSEVTFKALRDLGPEPPVWLFGDRGYAEKGAELAYVPFDLPVFSSARSAAAAGATRAMIGISAEATPLEFGVVRADYGRVSLASIDAAIDAVSAGHCSALVTAPIHKRAVKLAGSEHPGHTEILATKAGLKTYGLDYAMMFDSPTLCVALLSVHLSLTNAIKAITAEKVADLAGLASKHYRRLHGSVPRVAIAGVNPHAGEDRAFGDDEIEIERGVALARERGVDAIGPFAPDTVFVSASRGRYDLVVAMYHDQGLIPVKALHFEDSVNVTIGLPYLRCSVDHGTAFDIAGRGVADARPMRYAIEWAAKHALKFKS